MTAETSVLTLHQRHSDRICGNSIGARSSALSRYRVLARCICPSYDGRRIPPFFHHTKDSAPYIGALSLVHSTGVEPTAFAVGGRRSIQLRYECVFARFYRAYIIVYSSTAGGKTETFTCKMRFTVALVISISRFK